MTPVLRKIFFEPGVAFFSECVWRPAVDVKRVPHGWVIKAELPGVALEQVQVSIQGNSVLLSGVRRDTLHEQGGSTYTMEISYCRFERRVELPASIEGSELTLAATDGWLILRLLEPHAGTER